MWLHDHPVKVNKKMDSSTQQAKIVGALGKSQISEGMDEGQQRIHWRAIWFQKQNIQFVHGILFATSASKRYISKLQNVIQIDAAHLNFGTYMLFSA